MALCRPVVADLAQAKKNWPKLSTTAKVRVLDELAQSPAPKLLSQIGKWLADEDSSVRLKLISVAARSARQDKLTRQATKTIEGYVARWLDARREREAAEFKAVCKEHGAKLPPDDEIAAGAYWKDPWDESRRKLPADTLAERAHVLGLIEALAPSRAPGAAPAANSGAPGQPRGAAAPAGTGNRAFGPTLLRLFAEHHDPKVLVRLIETFGARKEWRALPALADLWRPLSLGRMVGGSDVIGKKRWQTMRLKWDVHKDRLWWSRPEYVLHAGSPIRKATRAITGREFTNIADLDRWLLGHDAELKKHGVKLDRAFRRRAASSQR